MKQYKRGITFGTYDLFHIGHLNILERSKDLCDYLCVGVSSDALNYSKKKAYPVYNETDRMQIVRALSVVDFVFLEESLEKKVDYVKEYSADVLVMGSDWEGKFDFCKPYCDVIYLPRTEGISTTKVKEDVKKFN